MRMWNVNPKILCMQHLMSEHYECHTMTGTLRKGLSITRYLNGLYDISKLIERHNILVEEILKRGYKHNSQITNQDKKIISNWLKNNSDYGLVDSSKNLRSLSWKCKGCRELQRKNIIKEKVIDIVELKRLYELGLGTEKIGEVFNCDGESIRNIMIQNNISLRNPSCYRKRKINESFFDSIDNEVKAYILGFIYADGSISSSSTGYYLNIQLHKKDEYILKRFLESMNSDYIITEYEGYPSLTIGSKKIVEKLINYGCIPNKSILGAKYPKLGKELERHFIRGFFDGNGWITYNHKTNKDFQVGFSGHKSILSEIKKVLFKECNLKKETHIIFDKNGVTGMFVYGGTKQVLKIKDFLYKNATIYLTRKFEKFKLIKECKF